MIVGPTVDNNNKKLHIKLILIPNISFLPILKTLIFLNWFKMLSTVVYLSTSDFSGCLATCLIWF